MCACVYMSWAWARRPSTALCHRGADGRLAMDSVMWENGSTNPESLCAAPPPKMSTAQHTADAPSREGIIGGCTDTPNADRQTGLADGRNGGPEKSVVCETTTPVSRDDSMPIDTPTSMATAMSTETTQPQLAPPVQRHRRGGLAFQILSDWVWEIWFCFISVASFISKPAVGLAPP